MTNFEHGLTPDEFTTLLNLMPIICKRGGFSITEYKEILPLYEKMSATAKSYPQLFAFDGAEGDEKASDEDARAEEEGADEEGRQEESEEEEEEKGEVEDDIDSNGSAYESDGEQQQQDEPEQETHMDMSATTGVELELAAVKAELMQLRTAIGR